MRYAKIILTSIFLLAWQIYIPVHIACEENEHTNNVSMSCCSGEDKCNCCCSHNIGLESKTQCSQCEKIDIEENSKVFEFKKNIADCSIARIIYTVINPKISSVRTGIITPERIHFKEKSFILISSLLI